MYARISDIVRYVGLVVAKKTPCDKLSQFVSNKYSGIYSILFSTYLIIATAVILLVVNSYPSHIAIAGLIVCAVAFLYITAVLMVLHLNYHHAATYLLLLFYMLLAGGVMWGLGVNMAIGTLIFGLVIVLAGLLLTAPHALFAAVTAGAMLIGVQAAVTFRWLSLNGLETENLSLCNVLACCILFIVIALVMWSYIRKRERSLATFKQAESILLEQKAILKVQSKKHMTELRQMQLQEMRQMYHFAELGQHGITLLHDFANHLTALKLEAEALRGGQHAKAILPTQQIIQCLDDIIGNTYERLHGGRHEQKFNLNTKINETVEFLKNKAVEAQTRIEWQPPAGSWKYTGDAASLGQVLAIIISNAIDAYGALRNPAFPPSVRRVSVTMQRTTADFIIRIGDWGKGIPKCQHKYLFQPFRSTKKSGLGLGLYIAKSIMEMQFSGTIQLNSRSDHTEFVVILPIKERKSL
jgi:signal transduction histidine kinase